MKIYDYAYYFLLEIASLLAISVRSGFKALDYVQGQGRSIFETTGIVNYFEDFKNARTLPLGIR